MEKLKVVWICHFSNHNIREKLPLSSWKFTNKIRGLLGFSKLKHVDFASWVSNQIVEFEKIESVELHVISPHAGLKKLRHTFEDRGIWYYFYKSDFFSGVSKLKERLTGKKRKSYRFNRLLVSQFIEYINPDIVNLIGSENPYYSITALDVKNIPVFVSCQTVYTNPMRKQHSGSVDETRWNTELKIHRQIPYYGCAGRMHRDLVLNNNPHAIIFKYFFPIAVPNKVQIDEKVYNFVLFASGVTKQKGIEDAINALAIVVNNYPKTMLNVVGRCSPQYLSILRKTIEVNGLENNVIFHDYFPLQSDMHVHIQQSKYALLPLKLDVISSSIIEAIYLDLPVVTYKTSGTPYLNRDDQAVLIAEMNNIEQLAQHMIKLLESPELADTLRKNARAFVDKEFNNTVSAQRLVKTYHAIINHYHHNEPIPEELLFNPEKFPVY